MCLSFVFVSFKSRGNGTPLLGGLCEGRGVLQDPVSAQEGGLCCPLHGVDVVLHHVVSHRTRRTNTQNANRQKKKNVVKRKTHVCEQGKTSSDGLQDVYTYLPLKRMTSTCPLHRFSVPCVARYSPSPVVLSWPTQSHDRETHQVQHHKIRNWLCWCG